MKHVDIVIVGAGMAGLTAAAYLTQAKFKVALIEKDAACGGLLGSFFVDGHCLDKGARGIIDSGIIFPMLKQLNINVDFLPNPVKIVIKDQGVDLTNPASLDDYETLLNHHFPQETTSIAHIMADIKKVMKYMDVLYGIENPLFLPKPYSLPYLQHTLLPWMISFIPNMSKAMRMFDPVDVHLRRYTSNEALISMIMQHFFEKTPAFFALSYFTLYMQYHYPKGGTKALVDGMVNAILAHGGEIYNSTEVSALNPHSNCIETHQGHTFTYKKCIWAADTTYLYAKLKDVEKLPRRVLRRIQQRQQRISHKKGADSILSLYLICHIPPQTFSTMFGPHSFVTPQLSGLHTVSLDELIQPDHTFTKDKTRLFDWIKRYLHVNTFEISIPSLRDPQLSPPDECTLIVSTLFDFHLTQHLADCGYYNEFKEVVTNTIIEIFTPTIPHLASKITKSLIASPLTIASRTHNHEGSVTGWSFANKPFPVHYEFLKVSQAVKTPIPHVTQAGQWTFNPAGVPVAVLTGKLAADAVIKHMK